MILVNFRDATLCTLGATRSLMCIQPFKNR